MSDELAAVVASSMDVAMLDDLLRETMERLRAEHPLAMLHGVRITFSAYQRSTQPEEREIDWTLQVDNEHAYGPARGSAYEELRRRVKGASNVPMVAARVGAVLRERDLPADLSSREVERALEDALAIWKREHREQENR